MPKEKRRARRTKYLVWFALVFPLLLFLISFWSDISRTLAYFWSVFYWLLFGRDQALPLPDPNVVRSMAVVGFTTLVGYGGTFLVWLILSSMQALLPVESLDEILSTASHQISYLLGEHGPAMFVQEGKMEFTSEELKRTGAGVIVVNFNSALVLESMVGHTGCLSMPAVVINRLLGALFKSAPAPTSRVCGPGIAFTAPNERIRAVVDLRNQARGRPKVSGYTRDGIELTSNVNAAFTIGQDPDRIELAYIGGKGFEHLKTISTRKVGPNQIEIKILDNEILDPDDRSEAHSTAQTLLKSGFNCTDEHFRFQPLPDLAKHPVFNRDRVFNAVFAQARNPKEQVVPWTELPVQVVAEIFRREISTIQYDNLYQSGAADAAPLPMARIKGEFRQKVRNLGLLSYRMVGHCTMAPLTAGTYSEAELWATEVRPFTASRVLRDRGIKILGAGFSHPVPSEEVYQQRLLAWRASWERQTELKQAQYELEAVRIRNHARALAQRDLTESLAKILNSGGASDEVMALRVLQALESAATDPKTRQLLPGDTISLMKNLHEWLLPGKAAEQAAARLTPPPELPPETPEAPAPPAEPEEPPPSWLDNATPPEA